MISIRNILKKTHGKKLSDLIFKRNILNESYYVNDSWDKFISSNLINKFDLAVYSAQLSSKLVKKELITPIDIDILATKLVFADNFEYVDYSEKIFLGFKKTQASLYTRDSTHHAFVRAYLDLGLKENLLQILAQKYKYGLFIDKFTANLLMDSFYADKEYANACQIAIEVMLQEYNDNKITLGLSALCAFKYLSSVKMDWTSTEEKPEEPNEDMKVEKILVNYVRNPYNDGHFDLKEFNQLAGKALYFATLNLPTSDLLENLKIYGLIFNQKFDAAINLANNLSETKKKLFKFVGDELKNAFDTLSGTEKISKQAMGLYSSLNWEKFVSHETLDVGKELENVVKDLMSKNSDQDINNLKSLYDKWANEQVTLYDEQQEIIRQQELKKSLLDKLNLLERKEEILTYFDNKKIIEKAFDGKGFEDEDPMKIPIEPDQTQLEDLAERHFKTWKKKNIPEEVLAEREEEKRISQIVKKVYIDAPKDNIL